jgi:hydrogenase maturation protein HypF
LLYEMFGEAAFAMADTAPVRAFPPAELGVLRTMLARRLNSPLTSSAGRLFDAVASLAGLRQQMRFEGQAAMELEFALEGTATAEAYGFPIRTGHATRNTQQPTANTQHPTANTQHPTANGQHPTPSTQHAPLLLDWSPMIEGILADIKRGLPIGLISARFHNALAEAILAVARQVGQPRVVLSGGCFQNRYLTERSVRRLREEGFRPYWHQRVPPNDGGISLGQVVAALRQGWAINAKTPRGKDAGRQSRNQRS